MGKDCILKWAMHESSFPRRRISLRVSSLVFFNLDYAIPYDFSAYEVWVSHYGALAYSGMQLE